jgi:excisionase family DNA binding protein
VGALREWETRLIAICGEAMAITVTDRYPSGPASVLHLLSEDRLLRPEQAAWYLNVKTSWVYEAVRAGRLPCHRVGRHIRFTRPMLDDWLAEQPRR